MKFKILFFLITISNFAFAQSVNDKTKPLQTAGYSMVEDTIAENRIEAASKFKDLLVKELKKKKSFSNRLDSLPMLNIVIAPDSSFRIITWQMKASSLDYRIFGILQLNNSSGTISILKNNEAKIKNTDLAILTPNNWLGALYYNMQPFKGDKGEKGKMYLLFGYNAHNDFNHRKICDVLYFDNGSPKFGAPVFVKENKENRFRLVFEYSAETKMRLNYDKQLEAVVFDKLDASVSEYKDQLEFAGLSPMIYAPSGSYDGYKLHRGEWKYVQEVVKTSVMEAAPVPRPVFEGQRGNNPITGGLKKN